MFAWLAATALGSEPADRTYYRLDNGLEVVLLPDASAPVVAVDLWYHVGSRVEAPGRTGFAHLFEHLMFQGSPNSEGPYGAQLDKIGARMNGSTNPDRTNYYEVVPREWLPLALFLEADRMGGLLQTLDQSMLDRQREVVRNERRQRIENVPYGDSFITVAENLYPDGHGYHHPTIGSHADLEAATLDDVSAFFRKWYAPNDATLVVSGDFDPAVARDLVQRWFAPIPEGEAATAPAPPTPVLPADVTVRRFEEVPQRKVWLAWHSPAAGTQADAELDLISSLLGDGRDGRLVRELVERRGIASDVTVRQSSADWSSQLVIAATAAPGHSTDEVVAAIDEVLRAFPTSPPTVDEVAAAEKSVELDYLDALEPALGRAELAQHCLATWRIVDCRDRELARFRSATTESLVETERAWLLDAHRVALHVAPEADRPVTAAEPLPVRARVRPPKPAKPEKPPKPKDPKDPVDETAPETAP